VELKEEERENRNPKSKFSSIFEQVFGKDLGKR
jgi:hypothetical protein